MACPDFIWSLRAMVPAGTGPSGVRARISTPHVTAWRPRFRMRFERQNSRLKIETCAFRYRYVYWLRWRPPLSLLAIGYLPHLVGIGLGVDRVCVDTVTVFRPGFPFTSGRQIVFVMALTSFQGR